MADILEKRVENLEKELAVVKKTISRAVKAKKDWRAWYGTSKDDPEFDEMVRLGQKYRQSQKEDRDDSLNADS